MTNANQAVAYLERFGYLDSPQLETWGFARRKALAPAGVVEAGIIAFQVHNGLLPTGELDEPTLALMAKPRCGFPDVGSFVLTGNKWDTTSLTYRINDRTPDLAPSVTNIAIAEAFKLWRDKCRLEFIEVTGPSDIEIRFATGEHGDGIPFDGPSGVLAHAFFPGQGAISGDAHFDEGETWTNSGNGIDLVTVAAHEFGHSLGLAHSTTAGALMYPFYSGPHRFLSPDDIGGIQALYGVRVEVPIPPPPTDPLPPTKPPTTPAVPIITKMVYQYTEYLQSDGQSYFIETRGGDVTPPPGARQESP